MSVESFQSLPSTPFKGPVPNPELKKPELIAKATAIAFDMHKAGLGNTQTYKELYDTIATPDHKLKGEDDVDEKKLIQILRALDVIAPPVPEPVSSELVEKVDDTSPLNEKAEELILDPDEPGKNIDVEPEKYIHSYEQTLLERQLSEPALMSEYEVSKKHLFSERAKLAAEIKAERKNNRERLAELHFKSLELAIAINEKDFDVAAAEMEYQKISEDRAVVANSIAGRVRALISEKIGFAFTKDVELESGQRDAAAELAAEIEQKANLEAEIDAIRELVDTDDTREKIKSKIALHYERAGHGSELLYDREKRSVDQVMQRMNSFFVHMILQTAELRHNDHSNVSAHTTLEDDVDILLSLEPSISTSAVTPGINSKLWGEGIGVLLSGGEVVSSSFGDASTQTVGIKHRYAGGRKVNAEDVDENVPRKNGDTYNEFVVDDPKISGLFIVANQNSEGKLTCNSTSANSAFTIAAERGLPAYVMTEDRRVFELNTISSEGVVEVGVEVTPDEVSKKPAGLPTSNRVELGERVLKKTPFRKFSHLKEAHEIIGSLQGGESEFEMSREVVLAAMRDNPDLRRPGVGIPSEYLSDPDFIKEVAKFDVFGAFDLASPELQSDIDLIKYLYTQYPTAERGSLFYSLVTELKKNPDIQLLALEHEQFSQIMTNSKPEWLDTMTVRDKFFSKVISFYSSRFIKEEQPLHSHVTNLDNNSGALKRAVEEFSLVDILNQVNPALEFYVDRNSLFVKSKN